MSNGMEDTAAKIRKNVSVYVFNNYYCSNAYLFEKESVTLHPHTQQ